MSEPIRSSSNPIVKRFRAAARGEGVLLEGERLVREAVRAGYSLEVVAVREGADATEWEGVGASVLVIEASLFARLGSLKAPPSVLALAEPLREADWSTLAAREDALIVVAAGVQDPGNLGALARTAEAAGANGFVVVAGGCRADNAKALRGSMGSLLRLPYRSCASASEAQSALEEQGVRSVRAATRAGVDLLDADWSGRVALWMSSEAGELPAPADALPGITIPLAPEVESLNVTQAAAVLLFSAGRTR